MDDRVLEVLRAVRAPYIREFDEAFNATQDMCTSDADFRAAKTRMEAADKAIEACDRCIGAYITTLIQKRVA